MKLTLALFCLFVFMAVPVRSGQMVTDTISTIADVATPLINTATQLIGPASQIFSFFGKKRFAVPPASLLEMDSLTAKQMHDKCRHINFEIHLGMIQAHLVLFFAPQIDKVKAPECNHLFLFHSYSPTADQGQVGVFLEFIPGNVDKTNITMYKLGEMHGSHLGSVVFAESGQEDKPYDPIDHNCAHKIIHILEKLGIPITYGVGNYVVENLVNAPQFLQSVREHPSIGKVFPAHSASQIRTFDDRTLANGLVKYTLDNEYHYHAESPYKISTIVLASVLGCTCFVVLIGLFAWSLSDSSEEQY